jgi:hypothetical protein
MKRCLSLKMNALILSLIVSCSSLESSPKALYNTPEKDQIPDTFKEPKIPFDRQAAFYSLRIKDGKILPSYSWQECKKKFVVCLKWETKIIYFEDLTWFYANDFGLSKRVK